ncbi:MAG: hypothetical protein ACK51L_01775 [bacterium]
MTNFFYQCECLVLLTCNDDDCDSCRDGKSSTVYWYARKDEMFFLRVGGYNGTYFDTTFATSGFDKLRQFL